MPVNPASPLDVLRVYIDELASILSRGMYISLAMDLTLPFFDQKKRARASFNWARELNAPFASFGPFWSVTLMQGYVGRFSIFVQGKRLELVLISRRSVQMGGTRFRSRGISEDGYVANYCETEQLVAFDRYLFSHLQVRGSVPLFWQQTGFSKTIKVLGPSGPSLSTFTRYVDNCVKEFNQVMMVNLLSHKKGERPLLESIEHAIQKLSPEQSSRFLYAHFDMHLVCKSSDY